MHAYQNGLPRGRCCLSRKLQDYAAPNQAIRQEIAILNVDNEPKTLTLC
jgi:hypothetical protein